MWNFLCLWWQRLAELVEKEFQFLESFCRWKTIVYQDRWRYNSLFDWWFLFLKTVFFGMFYGLLRFTIYTLALALRLGFVPFHLVVELYVTHHQLRRFLSFFLRWVESLFGFLWLREWILGPFRSRLQKAQRRRSKQLSGALQNLAERNLILELILMFERWDAKFTSLQMNFIKWFKKVIIHHWFGVVIPSIYQRWSFWFGVRWRYFRMYRTEPWIRLRRRFRWHFFFSIAEGAEPFLVHSKFRRFVFLLPKPLRWGFAYIFLGFRFVKKIFQVVLSRHPTWISYRYRRPPHGYRLRIKRSWWPWGDEDKKEKEPKDKGKGPST